MAAPSSALTFASVKQSITKGTPAPVYLIHGDEAYYADQLAKLFEQLVPESERDFNLHILYASETNPDAVAETCRRFPMMAERQVVILKEAQNMRSDQLAKLAPYASKPSATTVLAIISRGAAVACKPLEAAVKSGGGIVFESKKLTDRNIEPAITAMVKEAGLNIDPKGTAMLRDFIGTDLARLYNEISKMTTVLPQGATITPESIETNIGISKDFNNFELIDAIAAKNAAKVFRIVDYFRHNPKHNPTVLTVATVFKFFSDLLIMHYTRDKSPGSLMAALGLRWPGQLKNYETGARNYNAYKVIEIISAIREFDKMSKGVGSRQPEYDLLHNLMYHILTAPGNIAF